MHIKSQFKIRFPFLPFSPSPLLPLAGLISAEFLSLLGNQVAVVAIPILVLQQTHSPFLTGIAGAGNLLPIVIAAFVGGRAIDRFGAWPLSVLADLLSCLSVMALPLAFLYLTHISPALIFLLVFAGALFDPTGIAARQTLVSPLARLAGLSLEKINTLRGGLENGADFIGPILGAAFIGLIGTINTFFVNAASFLLCAIIFALTVPRRRRQVKPDSSNNLLSGGRFIFGNPQLRGLAVTGIIAGLVILPFLGLLLPVLATQSFGKPALLGVCLSVFGISATLGALSFAKLSRHFSRSLIYYGGLSVTALAIAACAFFTAPYGIVLSSALAGLLLGAGNPLEQTILQEETPKGIAGQVFTSLAAIRFAAGPLGLLLAGMLIEIMNLRAVLILSGGLLLLTAVAGWFTVPLQGKK